MFKLGEMAVKENLKPKFNVSTIMPKTFDRALTDVFRIITPTIYYSLYSANDKFRNEWLPAAMPVDKALRLLAEYQAVSKKIVKIHFAFIKGENDSEADVAKICDMIQDNSLICQFNLVRYNPFSPEQGEESDFDVIQRNFDYIKSRLVGAKMVSRVGMDVFASCGMFVE
jgi:adenine C2-methylase RlmN of 23S rRNA A2503 and tRNA A37